MPYFNLADGAESTDASLTLKIAISNFSSKREHPSMSPHDDGHSRNSASPAFRRFVTDDLDAQEERAAATSWDESPTPLAVATLDVQTSLTNKFYRSSGVATACKRKHRTPFKVLNRDSFPLLGQDFPASIFVLVEVAFSKATSDATAAGEKQVARTLPLIGKSDTVPALFVVATTLFDCATAMEEAELQVYTRCGDTGRISKLSSARRGHIGEKY